MEPTWNPPAYLIVVPKVFAADSDGDTSEGEEVDDTFPKEYFDEPPYEISWEKRGTVKPNDILPSRKPKKSYKSEFLNKVVEESFAGDTAEAVNRVGVVIGHNRMRSLSKSINIKLLRQRRVAADTPLLSREIHFFWRPHWINTTTGRVAEFVEVRKFYHQLKSVNPRKARQFRKEREGLTEVTKNGLNRFFQEYKKTKIRATAFFENNDVPYFTRRHIIRFEQFLNEKQRRNVEGYIKLLSKTFIIPYREIRETIKNHAKTKECVEALQEGQDRPLYMAFQDADVVSMEGLFTNYDLAFQEHLRKHRVLPEVASGGYKVNEPMNPILEIGVLLDLFVRHFTAQFFPNAVYNPEPNTLILLKYGASILEASFLTGKSYTSPLEMPTLIADLIKKRKIKNLSRAFLFNMIAALTTAAPDRFNRQFKAFFTDQGKVVRWGLSDLTIYKAISQTHYSNRSWATNICKAIGVADHLEFDRKKLSKKSAREMAISMISRLFASYDPFEIARRMFEEARSPKIGFQKTMKSVLKNFNPETFPLVPKEEITRNGAHKLLWKRIDDIKSFPELIEMIDWIFGEAGTGAKIQLAAQHSMKAAAQIYQEKLSLNFIELSIAAMMSLDRPRNFVESMKRFLHPRKILTVEEIGSTLHQNVLETMSEYDWAGKQEFIENVKKLPEDQRKGYLGTLPMHWAAITGNLEAVQFLKSCKSWVSGVDQRGDMGLLPLHCAIRYCADNGEDLDLIKALATKDIVLSRTYTTNPEALIDIEQWTPYKIVRESPLLQALEELHHYPETLKYLLDLAEVPADVQEELFELIEELKNEEEDDDEGKPNMILAYAIKNSYSPLLIKWLLRWGADFYSCKDKLERESPFAIVVEDDYRNHEDRLALLDLLVESKHRIDLTDQNQMDPLDYALEKENLTVIDALLKHIKQLGFSITEQAQQHIKELRQSTQRTMRQQEPFDPIIVRDILQIIEAIKRDPDMTARQKSKMIQKYEWLREGCYNYNAAILADYQRIGRGFI